MVCQPMPRPLPPSLEACASISLRSSITISGRNGRPYCLPRLMVETSAEAGRTKAGNAIRPVTNLRLFTLPPDVNLSNSAFWIGNPRRFVHAGSLDSEQSRRIVGEDAPSDPVVATHSPAKSPPCPDDHSIRSVESRFTPAVKISFEGKGAGGPVG